MNTLQQPRDEADASLWQGADPANVWERTLDAFMGMSGVRVFPTVAPKGASEHFGYGEKRNDLNPPVDLSHAR